MSESLGLNRDPGSEWSDPPRAKPFHEKAEPAYLVPCPDCRADISPRAEHCPHCGRYIQEFQRKPLSVLPGKGWSWTIAGGIILSYIVAAMIGGFLLFLLAGTLAGLGGSSSRP
jgi:hypothetical protein